MLIVTSPAKTLDFESTYSDSVRSAAPFINEAAELMQELRKLSVSQIMALMDVNKEIAELNYSRFARWEPIQGGMKTRPAIFAYHGDIYREMSVSQYSPAQFSYLQNSLRIISGLYGIVRPFDMIQPYRLEMDIPLRGRTYKNLYEFWGAKLTDFLRREASGHTALINLASDEYAHALDFSRIGIPVITVIFKQRKGSIEKTFGLLAKRARGKMIDHMVRRCIDTVAGIKEFKAAGYTLTDETASTLTFTAVI